MCANNEFSEFSENEFIKPAYELFLIMQICIREKEERKKKEMKMTHG